MDKMNSDHEYGSDIRDFEPNEKSASEELSREALISEIDKILNPKPQDKAATAPNLPSMEIVDLDVKCSTPEDLNTVHTVTRSKDGVTILDPNSKFTDIKTRGMRIMSAEVTDRNLNLVAEIKPGKTGMEYRYIENNQLKTEELKLAYHDLSGNIIMQTKDGRVIERRADGSTLERDKEGRPSKMTDANNNVIKYEWPDGEKQFPSKIRIEQPGSNGNPGQVLEYQRRTNTEYWADQTEKALPSIFEAIEGVLSGTGVPLLGMFPKTDSHDYRLYVDNHKPDPGAGFRIGNTKVPLEGVATIQVNKDGGLVTTRKVTGLVGSFSGEQVRDEFRCDGTHKSTREAGGSAPSTIIHGRNGKVAA